MTNREAYEEAAGMGLDNMFFKINNIDPNAEYIESKEELKARLKQYEEQISRDNRIKILTTSQRIEMEEEITHIKDLLENMR